MKFLKPLIILIMPLMVLILSACNKIPEVVGTYEFETTVKVAVFSEAETVDFIELILNDPANQLNRSDFVYDLSSVNLDVLGSYTVNVTYKDLNNKSKSITITVNVVDEVKPVVTGLHDYTVNLNASMPNFLEGVTATDNYDGAITLSLSNFDTSLVKLDTIGSYNVKVTVKDSSNNEGVYNFAVIVQNQQIQYNITYKTDLKVPQYINNFDYSTLIESVKNGQNENLLAQGYTLEFNTSQVNTDTLGNKTLIVTLKNPTGQTVKTENKTVTIVKQVSLVFKQKKIVAQNNTQFKPEDLIDQILYYNNTPVTLGSNYILSLDKTVDVVTLGAASYTYTIKDANQHILCQETITITIKKPYEIIPKTNLAVIYNLPNFDELTLIDNVIDINGQSITLGTDYLLTSEELDTSLLGDHDIKYTLKDKEDNVLDEITITVTVQINIEIVLSENLTCQLNGTCDLMQFILRYVDLSGEIVDPETLGLSLNILGTVNTTTPGTNLVTYQLLDSEDNIVYTIDVNIIVGESNYDIVFVDNPEVNLNPFIEEFDYLDFVEQVLDESGNEITLGTEYSIIVDGNIEEELGYYDINYILMKNESIIYQEILSIHVVIGDNYSLMNDVINVYEIGTIDISFNYLDLVTLYNWNSIVTFDSSYTYELISTPEIDYTKAGVYQSTLELYKNNELIADTFLIIIIYEPQFEIIVPEDQYYNSTDEDINIYANVTITDTFGTDVPILSCEEYNEAFLLGYCELPNDFVLFAQPVFNENLITEPSREIVIQYFITNYGLEQVFGFNDSVLHLVTEYTIEYSSLRIAEGTPDFDPKSLISSITDSSGNELIIDQDVFIEYSSSFDINVPDVYEITFTLKDSSGTILYTEDVEIEVMEIYYIIEWKDTVLIPGEYTVDTFTPLVIIDKIYTMNEVDYFFTEVNPENYLIEYSGTIFFDEPGEYFIEVIIYDGLEEIHRDSIVIVIESNINFLFRSDLIELDINETFNPEYYLLGVYHEGIRIDNQPGYSVVYPDTIDTSLQEKLEVTYCIKQGETTIACEDIMVIVQSSVIVELNPIWYIELNDPDFVLDDLVEGIFDREGNPVTDSGYRYEIIASDFDKTLVGDYEIIIVLYDPLNVEVYRKIITFYVESEYEVELNTRVNVSDAITSPNQLVVSVFDSFGGELTINVDCLLSVEEATFDLSQEGIFTFTFVLKDMEDNILTRFIEKIVVIDDTVELPESVYIMFTNGGLIELSINDESFEISDYVMGIFDKLTHERLDSSKYFVVYDEWNYVPFGTTGLYYVNIEVIHYLHPDTPIHSQSIEIYITEGYNITLSEDLAFDFGSFSLENLITGVTTKTGTPYSNYYIYTSSEYDPSYPGDYTIILCVVDSDTESLLAVKKVYFQITSPASITLIDDDFRIDLDDDTFNNDNLIDYVQEVRDEYGVIRTDYTVITYGFVDTHYSGDYIIDYYIYNEMDEIVGIIPIIFTVGDYHIQLTKNWTEVQLGEVFDPYTLNYQVVDNYLNPVDLTELGFSLAIENTYDDTLEGSYQVDLILINSENQIIARQLFFLEVTSQYNVYLNTSINIEDGFTLPTDLVLAVTDKNGFYIEIGIDCLLETEEYFDISSYGTYTYTFVLTDLEGNVLSRFNETITVGSSTYDFILPGEIYAFLAEPSFDPLLYLEEFYEISYDLGVIEGTYDINSIGTYDVFFSIYEEGVLVYQSKINIIVIMPTLLEIDHVGSIIFAIGEDTSTFNILDYVNGITTFEGIYLDEELFDFEFALAEVDLTTDYHDKYSIIATYKNDPSYAIAGLIDVYVTRGYQLDIATDLTFEIDIEIDVAEVVLGAYDLSDNYITREPEWFICVYTNLDYTTAGTYGATIILFDNDGIHLLGGAFVWFIVE